MSITTDYIPSKAMVDKFGSIEAAVRRRQDGLVVVTNDATGSTTVAVTDGASNFLGPKGYRDSTLARARGLEPRTLLNGGEIVTDIMSHTIAARPTLTGQDLVTELNAALLEKYRQLGLRSDPDRRGELFTGYFAHVYIGGGRVLVTAVGDCYVAIDGEIVAGVEKTVDRLYAKILDLLAANLGRDRQEFYQALMPIFVEAQFAFQNNHHYAAVTEWSADFYAWLGEQVHHILRIPLVQASEIVTAAVATAPGSLSYPAIDGLMGLGHIQTYETALTDSTRPSGARNIILWTDGFRPRDGRSVSTLDDLEPVDPRYCERTAVAIK